MVKECRLLFVEMTRPHEIHSFESENEIEEEAEEDNPTNYQIEGEDEEARKSKNGVELA